MAFVSREDFYDNGKPRYEIQRKPETLLFSDKEYYPEGGVKAETEQTGALVFITKEYAKDGKIVKETEQHGTGVIEKEYNKQGKVESLKLNKAAMPQNLAKNSADMLKDSLKVYGKKGELSLPPLATCIHRKVFLRPQALLPSVPLKYTLPYLYSILQLT